MKVAQLINVLQALPQDSQIIMRHPAKAGPSKIVEAGEINGLVHLTTAPWDRASLLDTLSNPIVGTESHRHAFSELMPELRMLRNKGFTFQQIATLLRQIGLRLQPSMVRQYFNEGLEDHNDKFMERMDEQLGLLADMKKTTPGITLGAAGKQIEIDIASHNPDLPIVHAAKKAAPELFNTCDVENANTNGDHGEKFQFLRCLTLRPSEKQLPCREGVPEEVYENGLMEHPAIPGLMLSLEERIYWAQLEIDENGTIRIETEMERGFRIKWKKPIPVTPSATSADFVQMDYELFKNVGKGPQRT